MNTADADDFKKKLTELAELGRAPRRERREMLLKGFISETIALVCIVALWRAGAITPLAAGGIFLGWWALKVAAVFAAKRFS